jgi:hypothetical protein
MNSDLDPRSGNYSEQQRRQFAAAFRPVADRYRWWQRLSTFPAIAGIVCFMVVPMVRKAWPAPLGYAAVFFLGLTVAARLAVRLYCPGCKKSLTGRVGHYCPVCAHPSLKQQSLLSYAHCTRCLNTMRRKVSRRYSIRACTHCGLFLDAEGV